MKDRFPEPSSVMLSEFNQNRLTNSYGLKEPEPAGGHDYMSIRMLWDILLRRRWTVVTVTVVLATLVGLSSFRTTPVYRATARVDVEPETPLAQSVTDLVELQQNWDMDDTFLTTQMEVLKSDTLAWRTVEQMRLAENPHFWAAGDAGKITAERRKQQLIRTFQGGLSVQLVPKTRMLLVSYESTDAELAARICNSLVTNFIDYGYKQKFDSSRQAAEWMEQQLDELKMKVEKSQELMVGYEREHAIAGSDEKENVQEQMLSDLGRNVTAAQSERIQKESLYNQVRTNRAETATLAQDALLQKLEEKQSDLRNQYVELLNQYGPNYAKVQRLQKELDDSKVQIEQEQDHVIERIRTDYQAAVDRENLAVTALGKQREELGKLNELLVEHNILKHDFETSQQLYQNLLQKLKDASVSAGMRSTNIHSLDAAMTPLSPVRPRKMMDLSVGLLAGLVVGIMIAFAQEALDQSVKSVLQIESLLGISALGIIPLQRGIRSPYSLARKAQASLVRADAAENVALTVIDKPRGVLAEAYRALRTAILLSFQDRHPKTILLTSTKSGEGKTVTSLNLAQAMAQRKGPVVLVDCDLRKSGVASAMGIKNEKGVSEILTQGLSLNDALRTHPQLPSLSILFAGASPQNPAELLSSEKMLDLIHDLRERFEHVIIDSPPVLAVTDASVLSSIVDGVLLVVEGSKTHKDALARSHYTLVSSGANVLGVVFNKYDYRREGAYGYGSYFQYYSYAHYGEK
jgi:polysaccharide biosynthesis transport protein